MNRSLAHFFSIVGHPLLIPTYALLLLLAVNPYAFGFRDMADDKAVLLLLAVFGATFLIPGVGLALMKPLGMIKSLSMPDKQDRIGPYIIIGVFYLWVFKNLTGKGMVPLLYTKFMLGATIGLFFAFFINIFTKVSAHAAGMGGFAAMILLLGWEWAGAGLALPVFGGYLQVPAMALLGLVVLLAGLVGTARLALGAHTPDDLYRGYAAGFGAVVIAGWVVG